MVQASRLVLYLPTLFRQRGAFSQNAIPEIGSTTT